MVKIWAVFILPSTARVVYLILYSVHIRWSPIFMIICDVKIATIDEIADHRTRVTYCTLHTNVRTSEIKVFPKE